MGDELLLNFGAKFQHLYYYMRNFCNLIGLEQWYFSLIWNTYMWKFQTFCGSQYKQKIAWFVRDIWHKYHLWYFKIVSNCTHLTAREITYNNFEISLVVFTPNITTNHAITYTNLQFHMWNYKIAMATCRTSQC